LRTSYRFERIVFSEVKNAKCGGYRHGGTPRVPAGHGARILVEDFDASPPVKAGPTEVAGRDFSADGGRAGGTVTIHLERKKVSVPQVAGETLLETARRAGLSPPFSCEAGNCGTCMARLTEGSATMRTNDVLEEDELADGYILTCQAVPDTTSVTVMYE
jgi:ferredoxin